MTREQIYSAWAPPSSIWSAWAKPVLFSHLYSGIEEVAMPPVDMDWVEMANGSLAMVCDLPGMESVAAALALIPMGYRPVPLFNAAPETASEVSLVEVRPIMAALASGAFSLLDARLPDTAPPIFLLDSNRRTSRVAPQPGMLDNRSISLPTDFPSANLLLSRGIRTVLLIQSEAVPPQADLSHTLRRWQDAGIHISAKTVNGPVHPIVVQTPRAFAVLWYNLLATIGLRTSPLGGFGGQLPLPSGG
jgi:hypothetical protein